MSARLLALICLLAAGPAYTAEQIDDWPREHTYLDGSKLVLYQPQIESWEDYEHLEGRMALAFEPAGAKKPALGAFEFEVDSETDLESRQVRLTNLRLLNGRFPSLDPLQSEDLRTKVEAEFPEETVTELDRILAGLERGKAYSEEVDVREDPPRIFSSEEPAILVILDGEPILSPIEGNDLQFAVNTNWDLFFYLDTKTYYLRNEESWLKGTTLGGTWSPAGKLPKSFKKLSKKDENWKEVREHVPGKKLAPEDVPRVFVSEVPAELILLDGEPELAFITPKLLWVKNTESDLFRSNSDGKLYYLVSGRWFRAESLDGEWAFCSADLPEDFAEIPPDHERGDVLAAVPGTPQAYEAVVLAHIPKKAEVERSEVKATATYQGEPKFEKIEGTSMYYATNSPNDVIRVGDLYYMCFQAVWFVSTSPQGPWEVADNVAPEIYTIPPSSPVYHTTYVYVYSSTPTHVTYGYTSGYGGVYYSYGTVVYGTGWYYPPYVYYGDYYPVYYSYPYSYGAGTYYNPDTGTYGRGAVAYGPYGGAGWGAAYNPTTGTYARGAAAYGPYGSRSFAEAYNPRTGTYAQTRQGSNAYASWGATGVSRGNDWVRGAHYSDSRGTVGGIRTSEGTGAIRVSGEEGSGFVAKGKDNVYAGKDGNVYRRTEDGWEKREDGEWQSSERQRGEGDRTREREQTSDRQVDRQRDAQPGDRQAFDRRDSNRDLSSITQPRDRSRDTYRQLDRDRRSRMEGSRRSSNYGSRRTGGMRSGRGGMGRSRGGGRGRRR